MFLLDKVKNLKLELSIAREQTNRSASSKLDHMLIIQKSPLDKTSLGFENSISMSETNSTNFVSSSKPPKSEIVKPVEVSSPFRKIRVDLKESKPENPPFLRISCMIDLYGFVIFVERLDIFIETISSCKLQSKQISQKVLDAKSSI